VALRGTWGHLPAGLKRAILACFAGEEVNVAVAGVQMWEVNFRTAVPVVFVVLIVGKERSRWGRLGL
jgi:hypothetical protein